MKRRIWHLLPSAVLIALLALVARAQTGNRAVVVTRVIPAAPGSVVTDAKTGIRFAARPAPNPRLDAQCAAPAVVITGTVSWPLSPDGHALQPTYVIDAIGGFSTYAESPGGTSGTIGVALVDPNTGAPLATYPLSLWRGVTLNAELGAGGDAVVTRVVSGVTATASWLPAMALALDQTPTGYLLRVDDGSSHHYDDVPAARDQSQGVWAPMSAGPHTVMEHSVCTATAMEVTWVGQQRLPIDRVFPIPEMLQRVVCPVTVTADWVEVAIPQLASGGPIDVRIFADDGTFPNSVPVTAAATTIDLFSSGVPPELPSWVRSAQIPGGFEFKAGGKYWVYVATNGWSLGAGTDPDPSSHDLYLKPGGSTGYVNATATALGYRIIGRPVSAVPLPLTPVGYAGGPRSATVTATVPFRGGASIAQPLPASSLPPIELIQLALIGMPTDATVAGCCVTYTAGTVRLSLPGGTTVADDIYPLAYIGPTGPPGIPYGPPPEWRSFQPTRPLVVTEATAVTLPARAFIEVSSNDPGLSATYHFGSPTGTATIRRSGTFDWTQVEGPLAFATYHSATYTATPKSLDQVLRTTEAIVATPTAEYVESVRVPQRTQLGWVELAIPGSASFTQPLQILVVDSQGAPAPPATIMPTLTAMPLERDATPAGMSVWMASNPAPAATILEPGRDYWLVVRNAPPGMSLGTVVTLTADLGGHKFFHRPGSTGTFSYDSQRALSFRIIGVPAPPVGVEPIAGGRRLEFSVSPNPGSQSLLFRWSGGTGRMSLEIVDVSGRRVRRVTDVGPGIEGSWRWNGASDDGQRLPAGVYFARLQGAEGAVHRRVIRLD